MNKTIINPFIKFIPPEIQKKMLKTEIKEPKARQKFIDAQQLKK